VFNIKFTSNQSIVQQLTSEGNLRSRFRKLFPIGLIVTTTWSCCLALSTKRLKSATALPSVCKLRSFCRSMDLIFSQISAFSSFAKRLGTSPLLSKLLTSSKNASSLIYKIGECEWKQYKLTDNDNSVRLPPYLCIGE